MDAFNWVSARSACSLAKVFQQLKLEVESDVEDRNAVRGSATYYEFSVFSQPEKTNRFVVLLSGNDVSERRVIFRLSNAIAVYRDSADTLMFEATLTLNDEGECRFRINEQEYNSWQLRRMALEDLFFNTVRTD